MEAGQSVCDEESGLRPKRRTAVATREKIHRLAGEDLGPVIRVRRKKKRPSNSRCPYCSEPAFNYPPNLCRHVTMHHKNGQPLPQVDRKNSTRPAKSFHCSYCGKSFALKAVRDVHIRTHTGERPYQCTTCNKRFTQQTALNHHVMMIHEPDQKPHKCLYCEKRFVSISLRNVHMNTHTGNKPFKCKFCEKAFCAQSSLIVHTRTHTGELPYKCPYCDWRFGQCANLQTHAKRRHPFKSRPIPRECRVSGGHEVATAWMHRRKRGRPTNASLRLDNEESYSPQITTSEELIKADVYPIAVELSNLDAFPQHSATSTSIAYAIRHPQQSTTGTTTAEATRHPQHSTESVAAYVTQHPQHSAAGIITAPTTTLVTQLPQHSAVSTKTAPTSSFVAQHKRKTAVPRKYLKPVTSERSEIHSQSSILEGQSENLEIQSAVDSGESTQHSSIQRIHTAVRRRKGQPKKYTPAVHQGHNEISRAMRLRELSEDLEIDPAAIEPSVINREAVQCMLPKARPAWPLRRSTRIRNEPNKQPQLKTAVEVCARIQNRPNKQPQLKTAPVVCARVRTRPNKQPQLKSAPVVCARVRTRPNKQPQLKSAPEVQARIRNRPDKRPQPKTAPVVRARVRNRPNKQPQPKTAPVVRARVRNRPNKQPQPKTALVVRATKIVCTYCGESFSSLQNLQQHIGSHEVTFPYRCEVCRKPFLQLHPLEEHLQSHSGNQPYTCPYCVCGFSQPFDMLQHVLFHHSPRNLPDPGACRVSTVSPTATDSTEMEGNVDVREQTQTSQMQGKAESHKSVTKSLTPSLQLHRNPKSNKTIADVIIPSLQMQKNPETHENATKAVTVNSLKGSQMQGSTDSHENRAKVVTQIDWSTVRIRDLLTAPSSLNS